MNENTILATKIDEEELVIGRWGEAWQRFMRENYPDEAAELQKSERWEQLACEIEREAVDM